MDCISSNPAGVFAWSSAKGIIWINTSVVAWHGCRNKQDPFFIRITCGSGYQNGMLAVVSFDCAFSSRNVQSNL